MKWLLTSALLLFSCDAAGVPEIAGPLQFSASEVESCERLILTVPVTGNAHYVQAVLTSGEIEGAFKEPGDSAVAIGFRVPILDDDDSRQITVKRILVRTDEDEGESRRAEYEAGESGVFDVMRCNPYLEEDSDHGQTNRCIVEYDGPSTIAVPQAVTATNSPTCARYILKTFANGSSLVGDAAPDGLRFLGVRVEDTEMAEVADVLGNTGAYDTNLFPSLESGETYFIEVDGGPDPWEGYSIQISADGFTGEAMEMVASPDPYEPDDDRESAKRIELDAVQHRTLGGQSWDRDWLVFTAP